MIRLYPCVYKTKRLIAQKLRGIGRSNYTADIISYTNNFKNKYAHLFKRAWTSKGDLGTILFFSPMGLSYCMQVESILAAALERLGFRIIFLTNYSAKVLSDNIHHKIYGFNQIFYWEDFMNFSLTHEARQLINKLSKIKGFEEIKKLTYRDVRIGMHALASFSGELPSGKAEFNQASLKRIIRLAAASCRYADAAQRIIDFIRPNKVLAVEKGLVSTCEIFYAAIHRGLDYVQWLSCHEPDSVMFKRYHTANYRAHPFSVGEQTWAEFVNDQRDHSVSVFEMFKRGYLEGRWFRYKQLATNKVMLSKEEVIRRFNLDPQKKIAIIFSHILNDTNFFYGEDLFQNGFPEWLVRTVKQVSKNERVNWLLKLHPANIYRRSNLGYTGEYGEIIAIKQAMGVVPKNIIVIPADIDINPYSFFMIADYGVTVRGTVGAELPCFGIPVLTAGTGRYSGRGFTVDSMSEQEYLDKIMHIHNIAPLSEGKKNLAIKHAYLFFKERPAKYESFMRDVYPHITAHPIKRDIEIIDNNIFDNENLKNMADFIAFSKDEDYLTSKIY